MVEEPAASKPRIGDWLIPNATVFVASGCVMIIEIVAGRIISRHLGQSLYTWTSVIGIVLAGISVGNYLGGRMADRFNPAKALTWMFMAGSAASLTIPVMNTVMAEWQLLWNFSWPVRIVCHVVGSFLAPAVILGTISPLVAKMALERSPHMGRTIGDVYAWGAAGSIAGTFLAGFYLISVMGNTAVVCVVGGMLALLALFYGRGMIGSYCWMACYAVAFLLAFGPGSALEAAGAKVGLREILDPNTVYADESNYSRIVVKEHEPGIRSIYLDKLMHSRINLNNPEDLLYQYTWIYEAVTDLLKAPGEPIRAMVIGGGGYAYPHYLERTRPGSYIEVSEIDPAVTEASYAALGLPRDTSLRIFNMDARHRVKDLLRLKREGRDVPDLEFVYGDSINDYSVPYHLTTVEFNEELAELMAPDGVYMLNLIDIAEEGRFLGSVVRTLRETFPHVSVFTTGNRRSTRDTFVVICAYQPIDFAPAMAAIHEEHGFRFRGGLLPDEVLAEIVDAAETTILTDSFAPVEFLLSAVVRRDTGRALAGHMENALSAAVGGDLDSALSHFSEALVLSPNHPGVLFNMGLAEMKRGDLQAAFGYFREAVQRDPTLVDARNQIALIYARSGRMDLAIQQWEEVVRIDPRSVSAHNDLGNAYASTGRLDDALEAWRIAVRLNPRHASAFQNMAVACAMAGRDEDAVQYFRSALQIDPSLHSSRLNLARALIRTDRHDEAAQELRGLLADQPDSTTAQGLLDLALASQQAPEQAPEQAPDETRENPEDSAERD